MTEASILFVR